MESRLGRQGSWPCPISKNGHNRLINQPKLPCGTRFSASRPRFAGSAASRLEFDVSRRRQDHEPERWRIATASSCRWAGSASRRVLSDLGEMKALGNFLSSILQEFTSLHLQRTGLVCAVGEAGGISGAQRVVSESQIHSALQSRTESNRIRLGASSKVLNVSSLWPWRETCSLGFEGGLFGWEGRNKPDGEYKEENPIHHATWAISGERVRCGRELG